MFQAKDFTTHEAQVTDFAAQPGPSPSAKPVPGGRAPPPRLGSKRNAPAPRSASQASHAPPQPPPSAQILALKPESPPGAVADAGAGRVGHRPPRGPMAYRNLPKRLFDILLVVLAAPAALPLVAIMAALVMLDGASPFYRQRRLGRGGQSFQLLKLRSMRPGAEAALASYLAANPAACQEWQAKQKLRHDPRVTRVGRWLRKSSLDELPQLWNVLRGDMSLVGPRPMLPDQRGLHPETDAYDALRPGITGMWQVSERNDAEFRMRGLYDKRYDCEVSLGTDLAILVRTIAVVLRGTGC